MPTLDWIGKDAVVKHHKDVPFRLLATGRELTGPVLADLPEHDGPKVIYAAANRLGAPRCQREQIIFKQTPYALDV